MEIIEAVKNHKGYPYKIEGASRNDFPGFFKEMGYKVGVEVGVYKAEYNEVLCKSGLKIIGVDPWGIMPEYQNPDPRHIARQQELYEMAMKRLEPYPNSVIVRKTSMEAVRDFDLDSLDFVYIDGNHKFRYVAEDIYEWEKRVKVGGVVAGHDYFNNLDIQIVVKNVVDAYIKSYMIDNFYILGKVKTEKGELVDRYESWFWVKEHSARLRKTVRQNDS